MTLLINNVTLVDATGERPGKVLIEDGKIKRVYKEKGYPKTPADTIIDGKGYTLMPGFIDTHCHLRDPGYTYKEDMRTGMQAAIKGGFTTVTAMANTDPIIDNAEALEKNIKKAEALKLGDLVQVCAVTKEFGAKPVDYETTACLTKVFSNDGKNIDDPQIMEKALKASEKYNFILATHCEPETDIVIRDIGLLRKNGGHLHVCHISKKATLDAIVAAKAEGLDISCEVTPHHLYASGLEYKVHPPFRTYMDRSALITGVKNGDIDCCGTDHAPHSEKDKIKGAPGINNFETAFAMYHTVCLGAKIPLSRLSEMLSDAPAKRLGIKAGLLKEGYPADLVLVDRKAYSRVNPDAFISKSNNTPFRGARLTGAVIMTIVKGELRYDNGSFV